MPTNDILDHIVIGSGFGGSVSAMRLAEKGYRVAVLEQGRRIRPADMEKADRDPRALFWLPGLGLKGYFSQWFFQHATIVGLSLIHISEPTRPY